MSAEIRAVLDKIALEIGKEKTACRNRDKPFLTDVLPESAQRHDFLAIFGI